VQGSGIAIAAGTPSVVFCSIHRASAFVMAKSAVIARLRRKKRAQLYAPEKR
jgi:hypothetical protein